MAEIWKKIEGFSNYEVSSEGRVKSLNWKLTGQERIMSLCMVSSGYLTTVLCKDGKIKRFLVHRLVASAFIENPDNKPCVNHIDGNKHNNRADNLEWATYSENNKHAYKTGLTDGPPKQRVRCIETNQEFESHHHAARYFGVCQGSIWASINKGYKVLKKYHFELI